MIQLQALPSPILVTRRRTNFSTLNAIAAASPHQQRSSTHNLTSPVRVHPVILRSPSRIKTPTKCLQFEDKENCAPPSSVTPRKLITYTPPSNKKVNQKSHSLTPLQKSPRVLSPRVRKTAKSVVVTPPRTRRIGGAAGKRGKRSPAQAVSLEMDEEEFESSDTRLKNIFMKPGRKVSGSRLDLCDDCVQYVTKRREVIEILFTNIKLAFYQSAVNNDSTVLLQFCLNEPVTIGQKEHYHFQFFSSVTRTTQKSVNKRFATFLKTFKARSKLEVETSDRSMEFSALSHRSTALFAPTQNCLVSFTNYPFFVAQLSDVELISLDRVRSEGSFDMAVVSKDYSKPVGMIESIPMEFVDLIRKWLKSKDIKFFESPFNTNWKKLMMEIVQSEDWDPWGDEGWNYLLGPDEDEEQEVVDDEDDEDDEEDYRPESDDDEYCSGGEEGTPIKKKSKKIQSETPTSSCKRMRTPSKRIASRKAPRYE